MLRLRRARAGAQHSASLCRVDRAASGCKTLANGALDSGRNIDDGRGTLILWRGAMELRVGVHLVREPDARHAAATVGNTPSAALHNLTHNEMGAKGLPGGRRRVLDVDDLVETTCAAVRRSRARALVGVGHEPKAARAPVAAADDARSSRRSESAPGARRRAAREPVHEELAVADVEVRGRRRRAARELLAA